MAAGAGANGVVIVGAGLAGAKAAEALREKGFAGAVTLIGNEEHLPYERPPLSKEFLKGAKEQSDFTVHTRDWYTENNVDLRLGTTVTAVDTTARSVTLADGEQLGYDSLVLATGSRSRHPDLPGADADGVFYLRTVDDSRHLIEALGEGVKLAIVGGGWIGLEVAAGARGRGADVTVVHRDAQPLIGPLGAEMGAMFADLHRQHGVHLVLDVDVTAVTTSNGHATGLELSDGRTVASDIVLIAAGAIPNTELAAAAGLAMERGGVVADAGLRASAPDVYVVGDIADWYHPLFGMRVRSEHWAGALNHPAVAAANILGKDEAYDLLPYFYTDQYDLGMECRGHAVGTARVVIRGDLDKRELLAFWLDEHDVVLAGMNVNLWDDGDTIEALIKSRKPVDVDKLTDADVPLGEVLG